MITIDCTKGHVNVVSVCPVTNPITKTATKGSVNTLGKGMVHVPGWTERKGMRFHHTAQNLRIIYF